MPSQPPTLATLLTQGNERQQAIVVPGNSPLTYEQLEAHTQAGSSALRANGYGDGKILSVILGNNLSFIITFLAIARAGAVAAPLNPAYTEEEFRFFIEDAGASAVIVPDGDHTGRQAAAKLGLPILEAVESPNGSVTFLHEGTALTATGNVPSPDADSTALFLHTSGTTSKPKGVPLSHANLMASIANIANTYRLSAADTSMVVMPLFHVHGLIGAALATLWSGGKAVLAPRFSASSFWNDVLEHNATWYSAVPTIHQTLVIRAKEEPAPASSLRFIRSCSSALNPDLFEQMEQQFSVPVLEAYGMTEASHQMASNPLPPSTRSAGSVGAATGSTDIAIMDEHGALLDGGKTGEVVVKGPNVMTGYRNNPEANASAFTNGWFRTGDQGLIDETGYLRLTGRLKELINRGGEKIAPLEVDAVLAQHPAIAEGISFGIPDHKYGEEIHAAVVLQRQVSEQEIQAFCQDHLASFKVPKRIHFMKALPRTATGKIQRRQIADVLLSSNMD